jgi:hypothetical protein
MGGEPMRAVWSSDQKSVYVSFIENAEFVPNIWRRITGNSSPEKFANNCCEVSDADPSRQYDDSTFDRLRIVLSTNK